MFFCRTLIVEPFGFPVSAVDAVILIEGEGRGLEVDVPAFIFSPVFEQLPTDIELIVTEALVVAKATVLKDPEPGPNSIGADPD